MVRRLLLLLVGLGGAAVALVLWSGTAYASSPEALATPRIPGPVASALPQGQPRPLPLPTPSATAVVRPVVDALPPVVAHTVTLVRAAVTPLGAIVPALHTPKAQAHGARSASAPAPRATHRVATAQARAANGFSSLAPVARSRSRLPVHAVHHRGTSSLPLGVTDGPGGSTRSGSGAPFAVTRRGNRRTPEGWSHAALVVAREPQMVGRRDIARPG